MSRGELKDFSNKYRTLILLWLRQKEAARWSDWVIQASKHSCVTFVFPFHVHLFQFYFMRFISTLFRLLLLHVRALFHTMSGPNENRLRTTTIVVCKCAHCNLCRWSDCFRPKIVSKLVVPQPTKNRTEKSDRRVDSDRNVEPTQSNWMDALHLPAPVVGKVEEQVCRRLTCAVNVWVWMCEDVEESLCRW